MKEISNKYFCQVLPAALCIFVLDTLIQIFGDNWSVKTLFKFCQNFGSKGKNYPWMFLSSPSSIYYGSAHMRNRRKLVAKTKDDNICSHKEHLFQESQAALQTLPVAALQTVQVLFYFLLRVVGLRHKKRSFSSKAAWKMNEETKGNTKKLLIPFSQLN